MASCTSVLFLVAALLLTPAVALSGLERSPRRGGDLAQAVSSENKTAALLAASEQLEAEGLSLDRLLAREASRSDELRRQLAVSGAELKALTSARQLLVGHVAETAATRDKVQLLDRHFAETGTVAVAAEASSVTGMAADLGRTLSDLKVKLADVEAAIGLKEAACQGENTTLTEITVLMVEQNESRREVSSKIEKIAGLLKMHSYLKQEYSELMESLGPGSLAAATKAGAETIAAAVDNVPQVLQDLRDQLLPAARAYAGRTEHGTHQKK